VILSRPYLIGLTGSIGMGKSTVAGFFAEAGVPVWSADDAVHSLYEKGGAGVAAIRDLVPDAIDAGRVDRGRLSAALRQDPTLLEKIEQVIHPLVALDRQKFKSASDAEFLLFDIPLLFEGQMSDRFNAIVVVSAPAEIQRERVLARDGMTPEKLDFILSKQLPDAEKRERADFIVETDGSFDDTRAQVTNILDELRLK